jgi:hypothetical protein
MGYTAEDIAEMDTIRFELYTTIVEFPFIFQ